MSKGPTTSKFMAFFAGERVHILADFAFSAISIFAFAFKVLMFEHF